MASEAAQLVVQLTARLDQFERGMKQAGVTAEGQAREIEDRFSRLNPSMTWATTAGDLLGRGISAGVKYALESLTDFIDRLKSLPELARRTGTSIEDLFALQKMVGKDGGLDPDKVNKGIESLSAKLNDARRESTELSKLFDENGQKIKDAAGNAIPLQQALEVIADMLKNAATEQDKIKIAEMAGLSKEWVTTLEQGSSALKQAQADAAATVPDLQSMVDKAREFDAAWSEAAKNMATYLKAGALEFFTIMAKGFRSINAAIADVGPHRLSDDWIRTPEERGQNKAMSSTVAAMAKTQAGAAPSSGPVPGADAPLPPARPRDVGSTTKIPTKDKDKGGGGSESLDAFEREERRATESAARLDQETRSLGLNTEERTKNAEVLRLRQMLEREGIPISDEYAQKIEAISTKLAKSTAAYDQARQAQQQSLELQRFAGGELVNVLDQMMEKGAKASDIMRNLASTIAKALMQAAILGTGPFAGLLGTASNTPGSVGGLIGLGVSAVKAIPGFATGTNFAPGGLSLVGERGPELVNLPRGSQVIPNVSMPSLISRSGGSPIINLGGATIDARGSSISEARIVAILAENNRRQQSVLPSLVRDAMRRGSL